ncbi:MAG: hypothetical protein K8T89_22595, partial [Planctomycetes bacterium]|nr:hypothetical protein [Planctomycetota bacterium]
KEIARVFDQANASIFVLDPRGVGTLRPKNQVKGHEYMDALCGVEENIAYNAFLVGRSLFGMRVADVLSAIMNLRTDLKPAKVAVIGRRDAGLVAAFAAALDPTIDRVAVEEMPLSYWPLFEVEAEPFNAASIVPNLLRDFGDIPDVLAVIAPRKVFTAGSKGKLPRKVENVVEHPNLFNLEPNGLLKWVNG